MAELIRSDDPQPYKLIEKHPVTHDTQLFRFNLPEGGKLDFKPGYCITINTTIDGEDIERPYTPCMPPWVEGHFDLTIKRYDDGKVSKWIHDDVNVGDEVMIAGPWESGHYERGIASKLGMVAGGTGITPMLSMIRTIMDSDDPTEIHLLFANKTEGDIICREEFDAYAKERSNFIVTYALEDPPEGWQGETGRVTTDMLKRALPEAAEDVRVVLCGPPKMVAGVQTLLIDLDHPGKRIILP